MRFVKRQGTEPNEWTIVGAKESIMNAVDTVFLFDVDNTLLDNDSVAEDLRQYLQKKLSNQAEKRYWKLFEKVRKKLGYADYLGALQRYRIEHPHDHQLPEISSFLLNYPFSERLFPGALEVLRYFSSFGTVAILTDGDVVFQPHKIRRSGINAAVDGRVMIYIHKEQELEDVQRQYPAERYVLVDDKLRILSVVKEILGSRVTTVFPRQGHYALDEDIVSQYPAADHTIAQIDDMLQWDASILSE
jgi:FMN phosphatase YigB (HAD superfamily)